VGEAGEAGAGAPAGPPVTPESPATGVTGVSSRPVDDAVGPVIGPVIGLVGCGRWGRHILRDLRQLGCDVVVVARSDESRARAAKGGAWRVVPSVDELPGVQGVVVATTTVSHAAVVETLLPLQVPLFVEKPLTCDGASARHLADVAGDRVFVMDKWRYHPGVEELARLVRAGQLGEVVGVESVRVGWGNPHTDVDSLWILAPHDLSIMLEVLGEVPAPRDAVADVVDGDVVGMTALLGDRPWATLRVSSRDPEHRRSVLVRGTLGTAELGDGYADHVVLRPTNVSSASAPEAELRPVSQEWPLLRELRAFVAHVGGGPAPRTSAADAARIVEVIEQLRALAGLDGSRPDGP
jgi:predicted dehydrogenase